ncbi:MAG: D-aminoacylase [Gemmatimonadota bacterium]|nr:D-aminoacylase [Gemmatimonadota bacterium]
MSHRVCSAVFVVAGLPLLPGCGDTATPPDAESFLVRGATVVDGTGSSGFLGSVRVEGGVIAEVAADDADDALSPKEGEPVHDGGGLVLAPGFIDTHSHHDGGLLDELTALAAVSQGITTIVAGQDGGSRFPIADYFAELEATPAAVNVASYVGHGTLRREIMGDDFRREATAEEVVAMQMLLGIELASGALGLSTGLEYDPGIYSSTDEVVALAETAAALGGRYISHMRSEDRALHEAIEETIEIAERARLPVQISHFKLAARGLWGQAADVLARLDEARAAGLDITADVYPYEYWQSTMTVLFPERDFTDREAARYALEELVAPEGMLIGRFEADTTLEGKTLAQIADERGTDAITTYLDLIAESRAGRESGRGDESIVGTSMTFDDIATLMAWPHTNVSSDGGLRGAHPRGFGAYPRVLGRYVREEGRLGLEEAVHKMTGLAAAHMGLSGRGVLAAGAPADMVLFDPATVIDRATTAEPHLTAEGIERVWVAGVVVYEDGAVTEALPGKVLRRE